METRATATGDDSWRHLRAQALVMGVAADSLFKRASLAIAAARQRLAESRSLRQRRGRRTRELSADVALTHLVEGSLSLRSGLQRHALLAEARGVLASPVHVPRDSGLQDRTAALALIADWGPSSNQHEGTSRSS